MDSRNRRREDVNLITYAHELFSGERVTGRVRIASAALSFVYLVLGYGPLLNSDALVWQNPAFGGIFRLARPEAWGVAFWIGAIMLLLVAVTRRAILYLWSSVLCSGVILGWMIGVTAEVMISDAAAITSTGFGLYGLSIVGMALYSTMSGSLQANVEIYERISEGEYAPLRLVERRKVS